MTTTQELIEMAKANIIGIRELRAENRERDRKNQAARERSDKEWKELLAQIAASNERIERHRIETDRKIQASNERTEKDRKHVLREAAF